MKKSYLLGTALLMLVTLSLQAKSLVVKLKGGNEVLYTLSSDASKVSMHFEEGQALLCGDAYVMDQVEYFYVSDATALQSLEGDAPAIAGQDAEYVYVRTAGDVPQVYDLQGCRQDVESVADGQVTALRIAQIPKGTYVLNIGTHSYKFMKR